MRPALLSTLAALSGLGLTQLNLENAVGEIIGALGIATTKSQGLMAPANQLSVLNTPLVLIGTGPLAVRRLLPLLPPVLHHFPHPLLGGRC